MSNIHNLNKTDRPHEYALITAINKAINDIAAGKMTLVEILGCLDVVGKDLHIESALDLEVEE